MLIWILNQRSKVQQGEWFQVIQKIISITLGSKLTTLHYQHTMDCKNPSKSLAGKKLQYWREWRVVIMVPRQRRVGRQIAAISHLGTWSGFKLLVHGEIWVEGVEGGN